MSKGFKAVAAVASLVAVFGMSSANAYEWANVYGDYYEHDRQDNKNNTVVVGMEGGKETKFNDMYGFAEYDVTNQSTFVKGSNHFKVLPKKFSVYTQFSNFQTQTGGESVSVAGLGYTGLTGENWAFKPFVGYAVKDGSFAGRDTVVAGWSGFWKPGDVLFTNWTDVEINDNTGFNGGIGAWVDVTKNIYTGVQYTYSYRMAGETYYGNSVGIRIGYHF